MAQRLQVDSGLRPVPLRPQATPVDTFAPTNDGYELSQLAQSLQQLSPSLSRFAGVAQEKAAKQQTEKGEQLARKLEEQRVTYKEAVKNGVIKASDNPWFLVGAKQQFGRAAAGQYARALEAAIAVDPMMQSSTDPADFDKFEGDFRKKWLTDNVGDNRDIHFEKGFGIVDGYTMDEGRRFIAAAGARVEKRAGESLGLIVGQILDQHYKEGADTASTLINAEMKAYLADNPKAGRIANLRAIDAVADWARLNYKTVGRTDVEALLRKIDGGPGSKLFGVHEAKVMANDVEKDIISMRGAAMSLSHAEEQRAEQEAKKSFWSDMTKTLIEGSKNGALAGADLTPFIKRLTAVDASPEAAASIFRLRDLFLNAKAPGNDEAYREGLMWVEGVSPARPGQFMSIEQGARFAAAQGLSGAQFGSIVNNIQERERRAEQGVANAGSKVLGDRRYLEGRSFIEKSMIDQFGTNKESDRVAAAQAIADFTHDFIEQRTKIDAIADPTKQFEYIQKLAESSLRIHASEGVQKANIKEKGKTAVNQKAISVFRTAVEKASEADVHAIGPAFLDFKAVTNGERPQMSPTTRALLERLGVPLDEKSVKGFFLEWQQNQ